MFDFSKRIPWKENLKELQKNYNLSDRQVMYGAIEIQGSHATKLEGIDPSDLFILSESILRLLDADVDVDWIEDSIEHPEYQKCPMTIISDSF